MTSPWSALPDTEPFVLPSDRPYVDAFNARARPKAHIHLEVLPEPYLGRPNAPVVFLNLNPGFDETTIRFHRLNTYFIQSLRRNLVHEDSDYPFYLLDPQNSRSPGYAWWNQYLRELISEVGRPTVARGVLCVEYFPYASRGFGFRGTVPSQAYSIGLVRNAMRRQAVVVLLRAERYWLGAIPELASYDRHYRLRNPQRVYVTRGNCPDGYPEIIRVLRGRS